MMAILTALCEVASVHNVIPLTDRTSLSGVATGQIYRCMSRVRSVRLRRPRERKSADSRDKPDENTMLDRASLTFYDIFAPLLHLLLSVPQD